MNALKQLIALLLLFFPALASAGGGSCTYSSNEYTTCTHFAGSAIPPVSCINGATFSPGGCSTTGFIGKCVFGDPHYGIDTYYSGPYDTQSLAVISSSCSSSGYTWTSLSAPATTAPPFAAVTTGVAADGAITTPIATVTTRISVNTADVGKTGSVFETAMVPSGSLGTTLAMRGENASRAMALVAPATNSLILANLTPRAGGRS